ncbi:hypothetical protein BV394_06780 [Brevirhabdus pacifica]|uniref:Uncharacterized protein n=1 Tax=Brevirhabdus pacifica TaxID=1267768 RepID=A0A1U7DHK0_9RHOB|nr:MarR family transcriptional regulator [Brevirhabdus pacifica]APX89456.1 hypothetical protein BV394_06780 [Brevirhabdus pacifica]PJJ85898.1 MarR family transcriptional regulator [Brevirhabdus pacifica]
MDDHRAPLAEPFPLENSFGYLIRSTHRHFQNYLSLRIRPHGVTLGMWYFLRVLWEHNGLTQRQLSDQVGTMEPTTLEAIRAMEKRGLVRRERDPADGRKRLVFLTEEGEALRAVLLPIAREVVDEAAADFSTEEREQLRGLLMRMRSRLAKATAASD